MPWLRLLLPVLLFGATAACTAQVPNPVAQYGYKVVQAYPHDTTAFTQGLEIHQGVLYEGTGQLGESRVRRVDLATGQADLEVPINPRFFGEGITILNDRLYQLTWRNQKGIIYQLADLKPIGEFTYRTEGWGLTNDGKQLIMSDGSATLHWLDPETFAITRSLKVTENGKPLTYLNELEWVDGAILANIWQTDRIVMINPASGHVFASVDLSGLLPEAERTPATDVLNGVAWDEAKKKLYVTGKYWPKLYEIELVPLETP